MKRFWILGLILIIFFPIFSVSAQTCEIKTVCIDDKTPGIQLADCKVVTGQEMMGLSSGDANFTCTVGCKDGICIDDNKPIECSDTDGGNDYFTKGIVSASGKGMTATTKDSCADSTYLSEVKCKIEGSSPMQITSYKCPNGCKDGACIKIDGQTGSTCKDTDGGKDIYKPGDIFLNGSKDVGDMCWVNPQEISEKFCLSNGTVDKLMLKCSGLCEYSKEGPAYCTKDCSKSRGYYCHDTADGHIGIGFLTKECKWQKITPCQSNGCSTGLCVTMEDKIDTDGDGLLDNNESKWGTDPKKFDTDGDGYGDMTEIYNGFNPLGAGSLNEEQKKEVKIENAQLNSSTSTSTYAPTETSTSATTTSSTTLNSTGSPANLDDGSGQENILIDNDNQFTSFPSLPYYLLIIFLSVILLVYVYSALCLHLIAKKLDINWAWAAWIPVANTFLTIKCAGKPWWWFLLLFIPFVDVILAIILWIYITENLGKPKALGVLIILPIVNLVFLGYLAFSKNFYEDRDDQNVPPQSLPPDQVMQNNV